MAHNLANPQTIKDIEREKELTTEFAKANFWKLKYTFGHAHWVILRRCMEDNLKSGKVAPGVIRLMAQIRRNERQREWATRDKRLRELKNWGSIYAKKTFNTSCMTEQDIFQVGDNVVEVNFRQKRRTP